MIRFRLCEPMRDRRSPELRAAGAALECRLRDAAVELEWRRRVAANEERRAALGPLACVGVRRRA